MNHLQPMVYSTNRPTLPVRSNVRENTPGPFVLGLLPHCRLGPRIVRFPYVRDLHNSLKHPGER